MARIDYRNYKKAFKIVLKNKTPILDKDKNQLNNPEKQHWVQCYDPHDKVRKEYPKYIFVSDQGNLVSMYNRTEPKWLKPSITDNERESYNFSVRGRTRHSISYIVVAVCHGSKTFGKSDEMLAKKGRKAFGKVGELLQVHHEEGFVIGDRALSNDPKRLVILTVNIHQLFHKVPSQDASTEEQFAFLKEFATRVTEETKEPVIMISYGDDKGTISEVWNEDRIVHFQKDNWCIIPFGANSFELFQKCKNDKAYEELVVNTIIEHCDHIDSGSQIITCIDFDGTIIYFIACKK